MTTLISAKEFNTYLPFACTVCEHFQTVLGQELANLPLKEIKPTIAKCVPALLKNELTGRKLTIVYVNSQDDAPVHTIEVIGSCPDKLGPTGLNVSK